MTRAKCSTMKWASSRENLNILHAATKAHTYLRIRPCQSLSGKFNILIYYMQNINTQASLCSWAGWFKYYLVSNHVDKVAHQEVVSPTYRVIGKHVSLLKTIRLSDDRSYRISQFHRKPRATHALVFLVFSLNAVSCFKHQYLVWNWYIACSCAGVFVSNRISKFDYKDNF